MAFRIGCNGYVKTAPSGNSGNQIGGVLIALRMRCKFGFTILGIATQGDNVLYAGGGVTIHNCINFVLRGIDTGQMRCRPH